MVEQLKLSHRISVFSAMLSMFATFSTQAALTGVLPATPGGTDWQAYYDDQLDVTWAADANINGNDTWDNQIAWVSGLTIGGVSGWRLPSADVNGDGTIINCAGGGIVGCADNEMGFLFWEEGIQSGASGPFINLPGGLGFSWFSTESASDPTQAWQFLLAIGTQSAEFKGVNSLGAWAVRSGNIAAVPVPAAAWLFASGLIGLIGIARRQR